MIKKMVVVQIIWFLLAEARIRLTNKGLEEECRDEEIRFILSIVALSAV